MHKGQKGSTEFVVTCGNAPELFKLVEEPRDFLASFIRLSIINDPFTAIGLTGCVAETNEGAHYPVAAPGLDTHTEQCSDGSILRENVTSIRAIALVFSEYVHHFVALHRSLCRLK